jgi:hypothetical protein
MKRKHTEELKSYEELKKCKIELQLEFLKLKDSKMALEIMHLEKKLGVRP